MLEKYFVKLQIILINIKDKATYFNVLLYLYQLTSLSSGKFSTFEMFSNMETIGSIKDTYKASIIDENKKIEINILKLLLLFLGRCLSRSFKKNNENLYFFFLLYFIFIR